MVVHGAAYLKFRKSPIGHSTRLINKQQGITKYCIGNTYLQNGKNKEMAQSLAITMKQQLKWEQVKINKR